MTEHFHKVILQHKEKNKTDSINGIYCVPKAAVSRLTLAGV